MTQIHFTLDSTELQELISNSGADQASVLILTKLFNTLMEKQRDEYCQVEWQHLYRQINNRMLLVF